jgi:hypothetical protein
MSLISSFSDAFGRTIENVVDRLTEKVHQIPLYRLGLEDIPAVPFELDGLIKTLIALGKRNAQTQQAVQGLSNVYTIGGHTRPAFAFLWGDQDPDDEGSAHRGDVSGAARAKLTKALERSPSSVGKLLRDRLKGDDDDVPAEQERSTLTSLSLDAPEQFAMSWTTFPNIYDASKSLLGRLSATLTDADIASREFWPTISEYGLPYNLLFIEKIDAGRAAELRGVFGDAWSPGFEELQRDGLLYAIDLRIFETVESQKVDGGERFSPATLTLLAQDALTKALEPVAVRVTREGGKDAQVFVRGRATDSAWLYALQAAKASIGVYGIWLGHVYHWHLPTAAMQMTLYNTLPEGHPLYKLLQPQSKYVIEFDTLLLLLWEHIAPPTSISSARQFVRLENTFAAGRTFFDDDPTATLERLGISEADFTQDQPWDRYRFVGNLLRLWEITGSYVDSVVSALYPSDAAVADDPDLQKWMRESADPHEGNLRGLPEMDTRAALRKVLRSFLYRITAHGGSRLPNSANPGLTFVANFPPCLQRSDIPDPQAQIETAELLSYLPTTGTIGKYLSFFYIFSFSVPYESLVPPDGVGEDLFFENDTPEGRACNQALVAFRQAMVDFMGVYQEGTPQVTQWARNIET